MNYGHREEGPATPRSSEGDPRTPTLRTRAHALSGLGGPGGWQRAGKEGGWRAPSWLALPASFLTSVNGSIAPDFACRLRDGQNGGSNSEKEKWVPAQYVTWRKREGSGELSQAPLLFPTASEVRLRQPRRFKFEFQRLDPRACARAGRGRGTPLPAPALDHVASPGLGDSQGWLRWLGDCLAQAAGMQR